MELVFYVLRLRMRVLEFEFEIGVVRCDFLRLPGKSVFVPVWSHYQEK